MQCQECGCGMREVYFGSSTEPDYECENNMCPTNYDPNDDNEPDMDAGFEHDSAMESIGWGTDEDYGYYGDQYDEF